MLFQQIFKIFETFYFLFLVLSLNIACVFYTLHNPSFQTGHVSSALSSHVWLVAAVLNRAVSGDCSVCFICRHPYCRLPFSFSLGWLDCRHTELSWDLLCFSSQLDFLFLDFRSFPHFSLVLSVTFVHRQRACCWHIHLLSDSALICMPPRSVHGCHPGSSSFHSFWEHCLCSCVRLFSYILPIFLFWFILPSGRRHAPLDCWEKGAWAVKFLRPCISGNGLFFPFSLDYWAGYRILGWKSFFFRILKALLHCCLVFSVLLAKSEAILITLSFEDHLLFSSW